MRSFLSFHLSDRYPHPRGPQERENSTVRTMEMSFLEKSPMQKKVLQNQKNKAYPITSNIECFSKEIQFGMLSQYTKFSFSPPIIACRAEPYMTETLASKNSDTTASFFLTVTCGSIHQKKRNWSQAKNSRIRAIIILRRRNLEVLMI